MIEYVRQAANASLLWNIDGNDVVLPYRKSVPAEFTLKMLGEYGDELYMQNYKKSNAKLREIFAFFGGLTFVRVGMYFRENFFECFAYYADIFAKEWKDGANRIHSEEIGCKYVFERMLSDDTGVCKYDFRYILDRTEERHVFCELTDRAFEKLWVPETSRLMENGSSLSAICYRLGVVRTCKYMIASGIAGEYIASSAGAFTERREKISLAKLQGFVFGKGIWMDYEVGGVMRLLQNAFMMESTKQYRLFPAGNRSAMSGDINIWTLYCTKGMELFSLSMNFNEIHCPGVRNEVKSYLKYRFYSKVRHNDQIFGILRRAVNVLTENNPAIHFFADISLADVKSLQLSLEAERVSQCMIVSTFSACREVVDYLIGDDREKNLRTPVPRENYFRKLRFVNFSRYCENTPYIPEKIMAELVKHAGELRAADALIFRILNETGVRAKEAAMLEADCLRNARYDGWVQLRYVPYKVLNARRRAGIGDYHTVYISGALAADIRRAAEASKDLRNEYELPYLFLSKKEGNHSSLPNMESFALRINKLIQKHNICDESGQLWHYTNRQCRKTLVVSMIDNGATVEELVYQLGHLDRSTVMKYYAEVRSLRLSELNGEFFKKKFDALLSKDQLDSFSEEERRQLYVDFRLGLRRVELGLCVRNSCNTVCENVSSMYHCVTCPELCTGTKYLSHWKRLLQAEKAELEKLVGAYDKEGVSDYSDYAEYRRVNALVYAYGGIVSKLTEGSDNA